MLELLRSSDVCRRVFRRSAGVPAEQYLHLCGCYSKRPKVYLRTVWPTVVMMVCLCNCLIALGVILALLLPPTVPLKPSPMPSSHLTTDTMHVTNDWPKFVIEIRDSGEADPIRSGSQNTDSVHDLPNSWPNTGNGNGVGVSAGGDRVLRPTPIGAVESTMGSKAKAKPFEIRDYKSKNKLVSSESISQYMRQTKTETETETELRSISSSRTNANETNPVPNKQSLDMARGPESISLSRESNGHRMRDVISGIGVEPIGRSANGFLRRSPAESVKHQMESQKSGGSQFALTAGIPNKKYRVSDVLQVVSKGIYWSQQLQDLTPKGFTKLDDRVWSRLINYSNVIHMTDGCGRLQNRLITLDGGVKTCARHRDNLDQIQGDIFSFYLARILQVPNLPPATVTSARWSLAGGQHEDRKWTRVHKQLLSSHWNRPIVVTKFVDNLVPTFIPPLLRGPRRRLHPTLEDIGSLNVTQLTELVQWSDLIVFDYLTANVDRIVNNMVNERWDPQMMRSPAHNLLKVKDTGLLLFLDNESGLLHGYRLLKKYDRHHQSMLSGLCVFRERTAKLIEELHRNNNIVHLFKAIFRENILDDKAFNEIPFLPEKSVRILKERLNKVYNQIKYCKSLYQNNSISVSIDSLSANDTKTLFN